MLIWIGLAVAVLATFVVLTYNGMVKARNRLDEAWSGIDVQLKRRHDLVPNLVDAVKGYAAHERTVLEGTARARSQAMAAQTPREVGRAEGRLTAQLAGLHAVAENYPTLRASENFQQLSAALSELEDEIQAARRIYNSNVQAYNTKIQVFPNSLVASAARFVPREFFEIQVPAEREPSRVEV
jgi:LemA protein